MKFFDRKEEINLLQEIRQQSLDNSRFTIITGRRRIGKTTLVFQAYKDLQILYFFVGRKSEKELCEGYANEIEDKLGIPVLGQAARFQQIFEFILKLAQSRPITLFIDEFQDLEKVNPGIFSDIQRLWDLYKDTAQLNFIASGSVTSLMHHLFFDKNEPLYGRATNVIKLRPFTPSVLKDIMKYYSPEYTSDDLLALFSFTGGVAKYVELLIDNAAFTREKMIEKMISDGSFFIEEGKLMLLGQFGKEYGRYFSILSAIASGHTRRNQIDDIVGEEVSGYITRLENDYELISRLQPILETTSNKALRYIIRDNFLTFWFRFVYKHNYLVELNNYEYLREIINRDYNVFSGIMLERYFKEILKERKKYSRIGSWWDRKGHNEIDIVAIDERGMRAEFYEVKRNPEKINLQDVEIKVEDFLKVNKAIVPYKKELIGLSLNDM